MNSNFIFTLILAVTLFGCNTEPRKVVIPEGTMMPAGTLLDIDVYGHKQTNTNVDFVVKNIGNIQSSNCLVSGNSLEDYNRSLLSIKLHTLKCTVDGSIFKRSISGIIIDSETGISGLPVKCKSSNDCKILTSSGKAVITRSVKMGRFEFVTQANEQRVNFAFVAPNRIIFA